MTTIKTNWADNANQWVDATYLNGLGTQINSNTTAIAQLANSIIQTYTTVNTASTFPSAANTNYFIFLDTGAAGVMPTAVGNRNRYTLKNITSTTMTVTTTASQTIDGSSSLVIPPWNSLDLVSNNTNWYVV